VSDAKAYALELLKNWASRRAVVSVGFEDNTHGRLALGVTARIDGRGPEFLRFDLRPSNMGSPPAEYLVFRFDGSEDWEELRDDPLGGIRCLFKRPGGVAVLTLFLVPEPNDLDPEAIPGEQ
jgi:hypothetical protein